jgi:hypothetical protein
LRRKPDRRAGRSRIDAIAFYDKPILKFHRILETYLSIAPLGLTSFVRAVPLWLREKLWIEPTIFDMLRRAGVRFTRKLYYPEHHESHARTTRASGSTRASTLEIRVKQQSTPRHTIAENPAWFTRHFVSNVVLELGDEGDAFTAGVQPAPVSQPRRGARAAPHLGAEARCRATGRWSAAAPAAVGGARRGGRRREELRRVPVT